MVVVVMGGGYLSDLNICAFSEHVCMWVCVCVFQLCVRKHWEQKAAPSLIFFSSSI